MNSFGKGLRITIFGESHGPEIGVVLDGVTAGMSLTPEDFAADIARRAAGAPGTTPRREPDTPHILSGVYEGRTTGAPLAIVFSNTDTRSGDYAQFADTPRPGHADYVAGIKWGHANDPRGGGHFSGRLTLPVVAAGVVAKKMLPGIAIKAEIIAVGGQTDASKWPGMLAEAAADGDSLGGLALCRATGVPVGLGEPFWDSIESLLSHAIFSIPGVRGIEFGDGFAAASMRGSQHNDPIGPDGRPIKNGAGGVNGGLTNGGDILFRVAFKPTSSIARPQETFNFKTGHMDTLRAGGRHDVCFALRTPVIVEAMTAIVLAGQIRSY